ncbi:lathosterol oxidase-like [Liolophura sinensis]|uniref:lathosterol oxidase-like n=1 Tax=Liolophura sinensis TaxID=3198878 RepID=UPI003158B7D5
MVAVFLLAATVRGEWLLLVVLLGKSRLQLWYAQLCEVIEEPSGHQSLTNRSGEGGFSLDRYKLQNVHLVIGFSLLTSFIMFYTVSWGLQWIYYIKRRDKPEEWKCQPDRFLTPDNERHEIFMGSCNMALGAVVSGILATYIINGGHTTLYYGLADRGYLYLVLSIPGLFLYDEASAYYYHRMYHSPLLYRWIHKAHHRYGCPTAFSAVAMHPLEMLHYQAYLAAPAFTVPLHAGAFVGVLLYIYYYGMIDHSGIRFDSIWPWQEPSVFHDNHHRYFHCNFGANTKLFDWLHDTCRRKDRIYGEHIFGGRGKRKESSKQN